MNSKVKFCRSYQPVMMAKQTFSNLESPQTHFPDILAQGGAEGCVNAPPKSWSKLREDEVGAGQR